MKECVREREGGRREWETRGGRREGEGREKGREGARGEWGKEGRKSGRERVGESMCLREGE